MRAKGTVGTTDSIWRDGLAAVDFRAQARAILAQGPAEVGGRRGGVTSRRAPRYGQMERQYSPVLEVP